MAEIQMPWQYHFNRNSQLLRSTTRTWRGIMDLATSFLGETSSSSLDAIVHALAISPCQTGSFWHAAIASQAKNHGGKFVTISASQSAQGRFAAA